MTEVYFVTNRRPNDRKNPTAFDGEFSPNGLGDLRYGAVELSANKKSVRIDLAAERLTRDVERGRLDPARTKLGSKAIMASVRERMHAEKRDLVAFVHGYNVSFVEAVATATQLQRNLGSRYLVALFSWPSDGSMMPFLAYANDRQDAAASGPALARSVLKLSDFLADAAEHEECEHRIHLIAHSMGNYVLRHALQAIRSNRAGRLPRIFDQIIMAAADEDDDAFEHDHKLRLLPNIARRVNVYFNRGDLALQISDKTKGNPDRLGTDGPRIPGQLPSRVSQIDCSDVVGGRVEHDYFVREPRVVRDIRQALQGKAPDKVTKRQFIPENNQYRIRAR